MNRQYKKRYIVLIYAALALVTFAAYQQVRNHEFIDYDDNEYVFENPNVRSGLTSDSIRWAFTAFYANNWHPLTWLSHMLDWQLFGNNPGRHHLTNLLFHIVNTLLLFAVLKRMTGALWRSAFIAAAFAIHPLHVESVAWVAERKDVLSSFFWILTMLAYVWYSQKPGVLRYLSVFFAFSAGLLAKPMLVTLPFVLLLLDYWPLGRLKRIYTEKPDNSLLAESNGPAFNISSVIRLTAEKIPLFVISAASSAVTYYAQHRNEAMKTIEQLLPEVRIINAASSYLGYIVKMFYPVNLVVLYPYSKSPHIGVALLFVAIAAILIFLSRGRPWLIVGLLWYVGTLVPVIGLVQVGTQAMADRYTYLPSIGIFIIIAWAVAEITSKLPYRRIILGTLAGLALTALFICTRVQIGYWKDDVTLFGHAISVTSNNPVMEERYATAVMKQGRLDEAIKHYKRALRISPNLFQAHVGMGLVCVRLGKIEEAVEYFEDALQIRPDSARVLNNLGALLAAQGKVDEALAKFERAVENNPGYSRSYYNIALLKVRKEQYNQAIIYFKEALKRQPYWPEACSGLAETYFTLGNIKQAVKYWREALKLNPRDIKTLNNLAWTLATDADETIRNPKEAVNYAERISSLVGSYQQPLFLDTLAAAYAADGNFPKAVETAKEGIKLAESADKRESAEEIRSRLELYKSGQPYIQK